MSFVSAIIKLYQETSVTNDIHDTVALVLVEKAAEL
jgi:hypothetical protein